jgi:hypothetical protein
MFSKIIAFALAALGSLVTGGASVGCWVLFVDEPNAPRSIIEK